MGKTLGDVPSLIKARKAFQIGNMKADNFYAAGGSAFSIPTGWANVMWPQRGSLYVVYSYGTAIGWIDQWGRAKKTPETFSNTTSRHQGLLYTLVDDVNIGPLPPEALKIDQEDHERYVRWLQARADRRTEQARAARQRRYWTPERLAAKEARERAKEVADLYGIKPGVALRALTQTPDELTIEDTIASLTGVRVTRDAMESTGPLTHA